ncbi:MAG: DnaA/Hda family protein [Planctomycetota bacterium]|nr:DnaA/Hda family protein [Planctomycetota bacterium]
MRDAVGRQRYRLWFRDTAVAHVSESHLTLAVPTEVHRTWLSYTYGELLQDACERLLGPGTGVRLQVSATQGAKRAMRERLPTRPDAWADLLERRIPANTLDSFVAGTAGRFPALLLKQMLKGSSAENPPLVFLYGPAGSGKSHLLGGLSRSAARRSPGDALYLSARDFTDRYVSAVRARDAAALAAFRLDLSKRRIVIIDNVHELAGRASTQQELVRLSDRLAGTMTRLVLASRAHPRDLDGFSDKLRSRLLGGVVLRLALPTGEHLGEVLAARARVVGLELPEAVRAGITERTASVKGATALVDRWAAASAEVGRPLAAEWLEEIAPGAAATACEEVIRRTKDLVAQHYGIERRLLDKPTKVRSAGLPRRIAMYLVYRACALPLSELGKAFGLKSHSSASKAIREIRELRESDVDLEQTIDGLLARI